MYLFLHKSTITTNQCIIMLYGSSILTQLLSWQIVPNPQSKRICCKTYFDIYIKHCSRTSFTGPIRKVWLSNSVPSHLFESSLFTRLSPNKLSAQTPNFHGPIYNKWKWLQSSGTYRFHRHGWRGRSPIRRSTPLEPCLWLTCKQNKHEL